MWKSVVNFVAFLGWTPPASLLPNATAASEILTMDQMIEQVTMF